MRGAKLIALLIVVAILYYVFIVPKERFIPIAPSKTGDQKEVTPSGNVILY